MCCISQASPDLIAFLCEVDLRLHPGLDDTTENFGSDGIYARISHTIQLIRLGHRVTVHKTTCEVIVFQV